VLEVEIQMEILEVLEVAVLYLIEMQLVLPREILRQ
jgi:hypothetical protein